MTDCNLAHIPQGWSALPTERLKWFQDQVMWFQALEAAGLDASGALLEQAQEIMEQWREEDREDG